MKFGLDVPTTGEYGDARVLAQLAREAEESGWDGFFVWDVLPKGQPVIDPWIALTAIALQTSRIKIGLLVAPLARHRPYLVAQRLANLDQLSGGRVICTVGLGDGNEVFAAFGEEGDMAVRARQLDEGLAILQGLWTEDRFSYSGEHYHLCEVSLRPRPVQVPRIPLWVAGGWPYRAPFRRAARWDGVSFKSINAREQRWLSLDEFRSGVAYVRSRCTQAGPFEIVMSGETPRDRQQGSDIVTPFREAGATWWIEEGLGWSLKEYRERIQYGPPL
ncbi:LLM class flavin-dependent oxidoreductase [Dictyobacter aurantiacus]|uniref:Luciferase-like protein n=1 Tax=Dictyobacter aurantiacus TaxID=1936993 RepID=A0A401ZKR6_9CHLR|nr:LLM class flavin-dependent oxidoreductase [Dictyobacter aurantiacus]GCE07471.1 luciferase-like protein [Dictyobacter aurantiacus]